MSRSGLVTKPRATRTLEVGKNDNHRLSNVCMLCAWSRAGSVGGVVVSARAKTSEREMSFDEQPDGDPHGECAMEIHALQKRIAELEEQLAAAKNAQDCAESKLLSEGYRLFCDIDVCNCGHQWGHGGHANQLLREVCDALCDAGFDTNGRTILDALRAALIDRDHWRNQAESLPRTVMADQVSNDRMDAATGAAEMSDISHPATDSCA